MPPSTSRRTLLRGASLTLTGLAGCLSDFKEPSLSEPTTDETTTDETTTEESTGTTEPATAGAPWGRAEPEKDHDVSIENRHGKAHAVTLRITHDGEIVHQETYEVEPGADRTVYNFTESPVDGKADYEVTAELEDGQSQTISFTTDTCHGEVIVTIDADGKLNVVYSVC